MLFIVAIILTVLGRSLALPISARPLGNTPDSDNSDGFGEMVEAVQNKLQYVMDDNSIDYEPELGQNSLESGYGEKSPSCHMVEKVTFEDVCELYNETICYTQNKEVCQDTYLKNCTSVVETKVERACFSVTELMCSLVEEIHYQTLREKYQVQRCFFTKDRICDTIFAMDFTTEDDFQCIEVETPSCYMEEEVLNDVTCTDTIDFDCKKISSEEDFYLIPFLVTGEVYCARLPRKDCYNIPRTVNTEKCEMNTHRYCEKLTNTIPEPYEQQNCHFESKKICEIQDRTRIKKGKKYSYRTHCEEVPREICDQLDTKVIQPVCSMEARLQCSYEPEEKCAQEEKKKCFVVEDSVMEEVCDQKIATSYL